MADKTKKDNRSVVRNAAYQAGTFSVREKHNERLNVDYANESINPERAGLNVHLKQRTTDTDGKPETYQQTFNRLLSEGVISKHGLKADAKVFDELVFDINTAYFEEHGGYEYAKRFYEEAYRLAIELVGGEQFILSAVMHADERNDGLSRDLGRDIYHYHLHVVYIPVVRKELYYQKSNKNPELAGKLKEVITQISHSKKWPKFKNDKGFWVNSYSILQDSFHDHMKAAGYDGFERGERGSTAEHLSDIEYKNQKERERAAALAEQTAQSQRQLQETQDKLAITDKQLAAKGKELAEKKKKIQVAKVHGATISEIETAAKPKLIGDSVTVSKEDWDRISELAKLGVIADEKQEDLQARVVAYKKSAEQAQKELNRVKAAVKQGDLSVVYSFEERLNQSKTQVAQDNAEKTTPVQKNIKKNRQEER